MADVEPKKERKLVERTPWPPEPRRRRTSGNLMIPRIRQERVGSSRNLDTSPRRRSLDGESPSCRRNSRDRSGSSRKLLASSGDTATTSSNARRNSQDRAGSSKRLNADNKSPTSKKNTDGQRSPSITASLATNDVSAKGGGESFSTKEDVARNAADTPKNSSSSPKARVKKGDGNSVTELENNEVSKALSGSDHAEEIESTKLTKLLDNLCTLLLDRTHGSNLENYAHLPGVVTKLQWQLRYLEEDRASKAAKLKEQSKELGRLKELMDSMDFDGPADIPSLPVPKYSSDGALLFASSIQLAGKFLSVAITREDPLDALSGDSGIKIQAFDCENAETYSCVSSIRDLMGDKANTICKERSGIDASVLQECLQHKLQLKEQRSSLQNKTGDRIVLFKSL